MLNEFNFFDSDLNDACMKYYTSCTDPIAKDLAIRNPDKLKNAISEFWATLDNYVFRSTMRLVIQEAKETYKTPDFSEETFLNRVTILQDIYYESQGIPNYLPKLPESVVKYLVKKFTEFYPTHFDINLYCPIIGDEEEPDF